MKEEPAPAFEGPLAIAADWLIQTATIRYFPDPSDQFTNREMDGLR